MSTHPSSLIHPDAYVDPSAIVGPWCTIAAGAHIGPNCQLISHVVIGSQVRLEADCTVHPFAVLGGSPQIVDDAAATGHLPLAAGCVVREGATVSLGSVRGLGTTRLGPGCMLMAHSHVGHDCQLGARVLLTNGALLAGHVQVGDDACLGGAAGVHQFCRLGQLSFVGAGAMVAKDVPPYTIVQGDRAFLRGLNLVGLRRAGFDEGRLRSLRRAYHLLFRPGDSRQACLARCRAELADKDEAVGALCDFVEGAGRGMVGARPAAPAPAAAAPSPAPAATGDSDSDSDSKDLPRQVVFRARPAAAAARQTVAGPLASGR